MNKMFVHSLALFRLFETNEETIVLRWMSFEPYFVREIVMIKNFNCFPRELIMTVNCFKFHMVII